MPVRPDIEIDVPDDGRSNFNWAQIGPLQVSYAMQGSISLPRFEAFVAALQRHQPRYMLGLSRGAPTIDTRQRKMAVAAVQGKGIKIAVVLESTVTRGLVTAFSWMGLPLKSFSHDHTWEAIDYLAMPDVDRTEVMDMVAYLRTITYPLDGSSSPP